MNTEENEGCNIEQPQGRSKRNHSNNMSDPLENIWELPRLKGVPNNFSKMSMCWTAYLVEKILMVRC